LSGFFLLVVVLYINIKGGKTMTQLEYIRKHVKKMTQTELAYHAGGMTASDISRIERGWMRPYNGQAVKLSKVLGIPMEDLTKEVERHAG
jgi:ribosome-binding protein aMBF1 (putative translation factor)